MRLLFSYFVIALAIVQQSCNFEHGLAPTKIADILVQDLRDDSYEAISAFWPTKIKMEKDKKVDQQYKDLDKYVIYNRGIREHRKLRKKYDDEFWNTIKIVGYENASSFKDGTTEVAEVIIKLESNNQIYRLNTGRMEKVDGQWIMMMLPHWEE